jgi:type VI secretion system protein ImpC
LPPRHTHLSAPAPGMFGWTDFSPLGRTWQLPKIFECEPYARWRSFRQTAEAGYAALVLPRILLRLPYGDETVPVPAFHYQETLAEDGNGGLLWGNAAFALAVRVAEAFRVYHWCAAITGAECGEW